MKNALKIFKHSRRTYELELQEDLLGTVPKEGEIYKKWIIDKNKDDIIKRFGESYLKKVEVEVETVPDEKDDREERGWTGFHEDEEIGLFVYDYYIKGFLKTGVDMAVRNGIYPKIPMYKSWIDKTVFIEPRKVPLGTGIPHGCLERPIRGMTQKGERVSLIRSDFIKAGSKIKFDIILLDNDKGVAWKVIDYSIAYGELMGGGQWRSGGFGRWTLVNQS